VLHECTATVTEVEKDEESTVCPQSANSMRGEKDSVLQISEGKVAGMQAQPRRACCIGRMQWCVAGGCGVVCGVVARSR